MPFLGLAVFDDLFLQVLILLDECVQADIKFPTDSNEISNIRDTFFAFSAGNGGAGNLEPFRQGLLSELILLTNVFENLRNFHDDLLSSNQNIQMISFFIFIIKIMKPFANSIFLTIQLFSITDNFSKVFHNMLTSLSSRLANYLTS